MRLARPSALYLPCFSPSSFSHRGRRSVRYFKTFGIAELGLAATENGGSSHPFLLHVGFASLIPVLLDAFNLDVKIVANVGEKGGREFLSDRRTLAQDRAQVAGGVQSGFVHGPVILMHVMRRVSQDEVGLELPNGCLDGRANIHSTFLEAGIGQVKNLHLIQPQKLGAPLGRAGADVSIAALFALGHHQAPHLATLIAHFGERPAARNLNVVRMSAHCQNAPPGRAIRSNHLKTGERHDDETLSNQAWIIRPEIGPCRQTAHATREQGDESSGMGQGEQKAGEQYQPIDGSGPADASRDHAATDSSVYRYAKERHCGCQMSSDLK
jgi:hypothetical protein